MIEKLPYIPPSKKTLSATVQKCLKNESVICKPVEYTICPDCGNPSEHLHQQVFDDEGNPIIITSCPGCGWIQGMELTGKVQTLD